MKLKSFLENRMTEAAFAELLGVTQATVNRYVRGERFPSPAMIEKITAATNRKVTVKDWYEQAAENAKAGEAA